MEKTLLLDTMFDLINEDDGLEAELLDVRAEGEDALLVSTKDGMRFQIRIEELTQ